MRKITRNLILTTVTVFLVAVMQACGLLGGDEDKGGSNDDASSVRSLSEASNFSHLNLSSSLNLDIPSPLKAGSSSASASLNLASKKSAEACRVGEIMNEGKMFMDMAATMICYLEKDRSIPFGKK